MTDLKRTARIFGALMLLSMVFGVLSSVIALESPGYLEKLSDMRLQVQGAAMFQICMALAYVGIIALMYPIIHEYHKVMGTAYLVFRIIGAGMLFMGVIPLLSLLDLSSALEISSSKTPEEIEMIGELIRNGRDWLNHVVVISAWTVGGLVLHGFFLKSHLVPGWMAVWGILGCVLTLSVTILLIFRQVQIVSPVYMFMNLPTALLEIVLSVYLLRKGFIRQPAV